MPNRPLLIRSNVSGRVWTALFWDGNLRLVSYDPSADLLREWDAKLGDGVSYWSAIATGPDGRVWVMWQNGLIAFDPAVGIFSGAWRPPLPVRSLLWVDGMLWLAARDDPKILIVDPATFSVRFIDLPPSLAADQLVRAVGQILSILSGPQGRVVVGESSYLMQRASYRTPLAMDAVGRVWFADGPTLVGRHPATQGIRTYDLGSATLPPKALPTGGHTGPRIMMAHVAALAIDPAGRVWFADAVFDRIGYVVSGP